VTEADPVSKAGTSDKSETTAKVQSTFLTAMAALQTQYEM
jgi:hypothetical protein